MGIISDTVEDNSEFFGQFLAPLDLYQKKVASNEVTVQIVRCPFCLQPFFSTPELIRHTQREHGPQHIYIRLNNFIVRDIGWTQRGIEAIELGLIGHQSAEVQISTQKFEKSIEVSGKTDLLPYLASNIEGKITIRVKTGANPPKVFTIFSRFIPDFRRTDLDNLIVELQKELDQSTESPNFGVWKSKFKQLSNISDEEFRYFNGFYEYSIGSSLEKRNTHTLAKQHFEEAFGLLIPFRTTLAQTAIRLLGLKMNCGAVFNGCSPNSPFAPADAFFNNNKDPEEISFETEEKSKIGVYIDRFSSLFLDTLVCFYNSSTSEFSMMLNALWKDPLSSEKNNEDKLHLLGARYYKYKGEKQKAFDEYSCLQYHPIFGKEANFFLECQTKLK